MAQQILQEMAQVLQEMAQVLQEMAQVLQEPRQPQLRMAQVLQEMAQVLQEMAQVLQEMAQVLQELYHLPLPQEHRVRQIRLPVLAHLPHQVHRQPSRQISQRVPPPILFNGLESQSINDLK